MSKIHVFYSSHRLSSSFLFHPVLFLSSPFFLLSSSLCFFILLPHNQINDILPSLLLLLLILPFASNFHSFTPPAYRKWDWSLLAYFHLSPVWPFHVSQKHTFLLSFFPIGLSLCLKKCRKLSSPLALYAESDKHSETLSSHVHTRPLV